MAEKNEQEYYKTIIGDYLKNETIDSNKEIKNCLTAKMARKMTNDAIIERLKSSILSDVKNRAKEGMHSYRFKIDKKYDYKFALNFLKETLGYEVRVYTEHTDFIVADLSW